MLQVGTQPGGGNSKNESCRVLNLERESHEHLRWTHLEQVQHCTDLSRQVTFSAHTGQGKQGASVGMNVTTHQEEKNEETDTGKRKAGEERRQATAFKKAVCCPSAVVQGAA